MTYRRRPFWILLVGTAGWLLAVRSGGAVEAWQPFLDRLREAQLYDMALAYLDQMAASPRCPPQLKEVLDYEAGITLIAQSRTLRMTSERAAALDAARDRLGAFLAAHGAHAMASQAAIQLANVLVERGLMKAEQAQRPTVLPEEKKQLLTEARTLYAQAQQEFAKSESRFVEVLKGMPTGLIDPKETALIEKRNQARHDVIQARIFVATVVFEQAMTYPAASKERNDLLADAAARFRGVYERYEDTNIFAAPYARMNEALCYKELGEYDRATRIFEDLLGLEGDEGPIRELKTKTLVLALQTSLDPKVKQYAKAVQQYQDWLSAAPGVESSPDALAARFFGASACLEVARTLKANDAGRAKLLAAAHAALDFVGRFAGDYQHQAKVKLLDPLFGKREAPPAEPTRFAEARDRGQAAFERAQVAQVQQGLDSTEGQGGQQTNFAKEIAEGCAEAIKYYRLALGMVTPETPLEDVNVVRYHLAHLYLSQERLYEAAVLGEFLAYRHSESAAARPAALVALGAYARLYNAATAGPERDFAHARMIAVADFITQRWPQSREAADAWLALIQMAAVRGDLKTAEGYLERLPATAPLRSGAELCVGRTLWAAYLDALQPEAPKRPTPQEQERMLARARELLTSGLAKLPPEDEVDRALLAAALSLAQIHLHDGNAAEAVKLLENPKYGPLALVAAKHPVASDGRSVQETLKAALRAYVATRQLEKAEKAMDALEKAVAAGGDAEAAATLTRIYVALGLELQKLLESLRQEGKSKEMAQVADGFELFLDRIAQREQGNTFQTLHWAAKTFAGMAAGFDTDQTPPPPKAAKYYQKAADAYQKILRRAESQKDFAPRGALGGVQVGLATCLRRLGRCDEAMDLLVGVLKERNMMVDAQVQAAYTYQAWAGRPGSAKNYLFAIQGGRAWKKDGQTVNIVWGWGKLSKMVSRDPKYRDLFHEARYNLALCRFEYAMTLAGDERNAVLRQAERDITVTAMLYPGLGGPTWRDKYDLLLKKTQALLGTNPVGLGKK